MAGIKWRREPVATKQPNALRVGGFEMYCRTESGTPMVIETATAAAAVAYGEKLLCSQTAQPPSSGEVRVTAVEMWYEHDWDGMHLMECEVATA